MDYIPHFRREILGFEAAVRRVAGAVGAPLVPSCPGWSVSDLVAHLGAVQRYVTRIIRKRLLEQPDSTDLTFLELPADHEGWPMPEHAPNRRPVPLGSYRLVRGRGLRAGITVQEQRSGRAGVDLVARADHRVTGPCDVELAGRRRT